MTLDVFLEAFQSVRAVGRHWTAACPAHDDRSRNTLHLSLGAGGRRLLICRAGCQVVDVLGAVGLRLADLFTDAPSAAGERRRTDRAAWSLDEALRETLRRARALYAVQAAVYPLSDAIREGTAAVTLARAQVTRLGPEDAHAWALAAIAAALEREVLALTADQDDLLQELRRR